MISLIECHELFYFRINLVNLPQSLLVSCLLELKLDEALVQVILTSDNVLSVQSTILLGKYSIKIYYLIRNINMDLNF